ASNFLKPRHIGRPIGAAPAKPEGRVWRHALKEARSSTASIGVAVQSLPENRRGSRWHPGSVLEWQTTACCRSREPENPHGWLVLLPARQPALRRRRKGWDCSQ